MRLRVGYVFSATARIPGLRLWYAHNVNRFNLILLTLLLSLPTSLLAQTEARTLQEAVERVERDTGGKILSAETVRVGRQTVYRIKVLTPEGRVQVMQVRARERDED